MVPTEIAVSLRWVILIALCALLGVLVIVRVRGRDAAPQPQSAESAGVTVDKQPVDFAKRTFDPGNPPAGMPPFAPAEEAVCDSNFMSNVSVGGDAEKMDATHEIVTITKVAVTLRLKITIWVPNDASQHVIDHEQGHRQISEFYYRGADKLASQIASTYMGKKEAISGPDLDAALNAWLQQEGNEIADEYGRELNPEPTQVHYDLITNYGRNGVAAPDAAAQALKDVTVSPDSPPANAGD
jgi:hypothetical protein